MATNTEKIVVQVVVQGQKQLQNLESQTNKTTLGFNKMTAGIVGAVAAYRQINKLVSSSIRTFRDFEFQMAKVKAITGASEKDFKQLSETAKELGRSTFFTAQQVAELQTNFGKLGFSTTEILKAQEATLLLATATDTDLARAATVAGAAVRGFALDADETGRVVDVMAVAFTKSALDIEKFQTSMTKVAPIAAGANISLEATTAIMGTLTDAGIEASIAGTSLRNIFLKMQDPTEELTKHLGFTVNSSEDLQRALTQLNEEGLSNERIMQLVDLRQVAAFQTMVRGTDNVLSLTTALENSDGAGREMANMVGDTLEGAFKRLTSATEGLQIAIVEGFIGQALTKILNVGANVLNFFTDFTKGIESVNDEIATSAAIYKAQAVQLNVMADRFDVLSSSTNRTKEEDEELQRILIDLQGEFGRSVISVDKKTDSLVLNRQALEKVIAKTALLADTEALKLVHKLQNVQREIKLEKDKQDVLDESVKSMTSNSTAMSEMMSSQAALSDQTAVNNVQYDEFGKVVDRAVNNTNSLIEAQSSSAAQDVIIAQLIKDETLLREQLTDAGWNEQDILKLLNDTTKTSTLITGGNTDTIIENTKAKEDNLDLDREMFNLLMTKGVTTKEEEARITEYLNGLRDKAIEFQLRSLNEFVMDVDLRKKLLLELEALKQGTDEVDQKRKDESFKNDVHRAMLSGQTAEEAMKNVVRAQIMEAVAGFIASIFTGLPFPLNLVVAAGASAVVGNLIDGQLDKFEHGGLVQGKSHAQGGEKFAVGGRVVELEGGEAVINKRSTAMFSNQLSAMNAAGGGVKFADGGMLNSPSFSQQEFNALGQNQMMGAMSSSSKVVVVESDITNSQNNVSVIQSQATI
jgi:TP901 family phage tail tape measure protein